MSKPSSRILGSETLGKGKWLRLHAIQWKQDNGDIHHWEAVDRSGDGRCVLVVAFLKPSNTLVLVKQFRPALNSECLEFPAGLVDENETAEQAAIRELREETGYHGTIQNMISPSSVSAGLTSESISMAVVHIDESAPENANPSPKREESESMSTHLVKDDQWGVLLENHSGFCIDAKLRAFALARSIGN
jgi:ADP-ribose pyrophosphatase